MKNEFFILFLLIGQSLAAQNLVPNPSFEDENTCEFNQPCSPAAWFYATKNQVAGYFYNDIPAATGKHWISLVAGNRSNTGGRQYWETMLLQPLSKGSSYKVSISIHGWDTGPYPKDIGIRFLSHPEFYQADTVVQPTAFLDFTDARITELKKGWFRLDKEFTSDNDNGYIMIGNFSSENYQEIAKRRLSKSIYTGLTIDDIAITPVEQTSCNNCQHIKDSLYAVVKRHSNPDTISNPIVFQATTAIQKKTDTLVLQDLYFATASYQLVNPNILEQYRSSFEQPNISRIKIAGFTDDVGTAQANQQLSLQRAQEVGKLLAEKFHISPALIESTGYGISTLHTDKSKNRRVEIYIYRD